MKYLVKISAVSDGARDRTTVCLNHKIILSTTKICRVPFSGEWWHAGCPEYTLPLRISNQLNLCPGSTVQGRRGLGSYRATSSHKASGKCHQNEQGFHSKSFPRVKSMKGQ